MILFKKKIYIYKDISIFFNISFLFCSDNLFSSNTKIDNSSTDDNNNINKVCIFIYLINLLINKSCFVNYFESKKHKSQLSFFSRDVLFRISLLLNFYR